MRVIGLKKSQGEKVEIMNEENIDFLCKFYKDVNKKNGNAVDETAFMNEDGIDYSFEEDVIDELKEELESFNNIVSKMKEIDLSKRIEELRYSRDFIMCTNRLYKVLGRLSVTFSDFQKFDVVMTRSFPDGPKVDSELI